MSMRHLLLALVAVTTALASPAALACGGCFSPPPPAGTDPGPLTVLQDAERVFFHLDPATKKTTVVVEVLYTGAAEAFGWVLPLPKVPKVSVGVTRVFDLIDQAFGVQYVPKLLGNENCRDPWDGCEHRWQSADDAVAVDAGASQSDASPTGGGGPPGVEILDHGTTGPYDYTTIQGSAAQPVLDWLNTNGYATPAAALPVIDAHVQKGDVFVAVKLTNGSGVTSIRPIVLEMDDAEPCVPLRLTSIAATEDLGVVVTIAGPGRAIVKNHLDVVPNPMRLDLFHGAKNYDQVISAAIDEAGGRAFVTEFAGSATEAGVTANATKWNYDPAGFAAAENLNDVATQLSYTGNVWLFEESALAFEEALKLTTALAKMKPSGPLEALGFLWSCGQYFQMPFDPSCQPDGAAEGITQDELAAIAVDGAALVERLEAAVVLPVSAMKDNLLNAERVTRLVMKISPEEMDRDPVFAFSKDLPDVAKQHYYEVYQVCSSGWYPADKTRIAVDGLGTWVFDGQWGASAANNAKDPRFIAAPLALEIALLDETGDATPIAASQLEVVDQAIKGATPGEPSIVAGFVFDLPTIWQPPASDTLVTHVEPWKQPAGCDPLPGWVDGAAPPSGSGKR